ncbi:hypothetical protein [Eleftheria terrae]|uniref:hypothetical protein n=1 Tax=Eleftheria terrae TaxID=1597781 RepID=UPI00263BCE72|nr:hypothetical protein [Eleftheria terrae]WKB56144.1 hypothetical protein N7L95_29320 [Eleftheria terrae]
MLASLLVLNWLAPQPSRDTDNTSKDVVLPVRRDRGGTASQGTVPAAATRVASAAAPVPMTSGLPQPLLQEPQGDPFGSAAAATAVAPVTPATEAPRAPVVAVQAQLPSPPVEPPPPPPPPFTMTAIGRWEADGQAALFLSQGNTTLKAQVGDTLPGGFKVVQIDLRTFQVLHVSAGHVLTLPIGDATSSTLPSSAYGQ